MTSPLSDRIQIHAAFAIFAEDKSVRPFHRIISILPGPFGDPIRNGCKSKSIPQLRLHISDRAHYLPILTTVNHPLTTRQIELALQFARKVAPEETLEIHCTGGKYRSPALALTIIAEEYGAGREREAVKKLLEIRPLAAPSLHMVKTIDGYLKRDGKLLTAVLSEPSILVTYAADEVDTRQNWPNDETISRPVFLTDADGRIKPNPEIFEHLGWR